MTKANRNFGEDPTITGPGLDAFNPGGSDFGVVRQVDGHIPFEVGAEGSAIHQPTGPDPQWNDPIGPAVQDD